MPLSLFVCHQAKSNRAGVTRMLPVSEKKTRKLNFLLQNYCKNKIKMYLFHSFYFLKLKTFLMELNGNIQTE